MKYKPMNANDAAWRPVRFFCALILAAGAAAQELPTILRVDVQNWTYYANDQSDPTKWARTTAPVVPVYPANFYTEIGIMDVIAINGSPAKGVIVIRYQNLGLTPAVSDLTRGGTIEYLMEFLKPDGTSFGSIVALGLAGGTPPAAGALVAAKGGNNMIVGGSGAFLGARGTVHSAGSRGVRLASQAEDPSMRRINPSGTGSWLLQIWPTFRPEVLVTPTGPGVFHADFSAVTAEKPAQRGETLILYAKGLGFTLPRVDAGDPFPADPLVAVTSPVEVLVNGNPSPAIVQVGVPGTTDTYRVDFQVPETTEAGMAPIQLSAAWVKGTAVRIPVR